MDELSGSSDESSVRRPESAVGRPRQPELTDRLLDAARDAFSAGGLAGFTIAEVERRSGVPRSTIYRRWPSAHALLFEALFSTLDGAVPLPDTGSSVEDIRLGMHAFVDRLRDEAMLEAIRAVVATMLSDPGSRDAFTAAMDRDRATIAAVFERGRQRGERLRDIEPLVLAEVFIAWAVHRCLLHGGPPSDAEIDALVVSVLGDR